MSKRRLPDNLSIDTLAIRAAELRTDEMSHSEALFLTSSFVYESAAQAAARFSGTEPGNIYSRFSNPTVRAFEERLASLEGAQQCVAFASGMAAINAVFMAHLKPGDHIVSSRSLFGTTQVLYDKYLSKFGIEVTLVDIADLAQWRAALRPQTKFLFVETPSNPLAEVADIKALADIGHSVGAKLIVDNCFCTPALQRPLELGADIIIHSATKYLDGQGRCLGGAALGRSEDMAEVYSYLRTTGATLSAFNAWVFLKGLETLTLRMKAHSANALALASWLQQQPGVQQVHYAGLADNRYHDLAARQQSAFGGVLSFTVVDSAGQGDRQAAWRFIDATELVSITANLGDVKSTITHPASTTHGRLAEQEKQRTGISENLIRLAVGLEGIEDIKADMRRGLVALGFSQ